MTIDTTIAQAIVAHLETQIGVGPTARSFVRLEGFSTATYSILIGELARRSYRLTERALVVRTIDPIAGFLELAMEPDRSATWYRNHLPAGQTLLLILNRRTTDAQSLQDIYGISEQTLTREGLSALITAGFTRYQVSEAERETLREFVRRLRRLRMEPQLRDLAEFLRHVDAHLDGNPGATVADAIAEALPALNLFRCRELALHINNLPRSEKLLRDLKAAAQIGGEMLDDKARTAYLQRLANAELADDQAFGGRSAAEKAALLRNFIDGALADQRDALAHVLQIDWQEVRQIIVPRSKQSKVERYARVAAQLQAQAEHLGLAEDADLIDVVDALREGREPAGEALERVLEAGGDTITKSLRNNLRRMVRPPSRRSADFLVGLTALAVELLYNQRETLAAGSFLRVTPAPGTLDDSKELPEAAAVFRAMYGGLEQALPAVQWDLARLWAFAAAPAADADAEEQHEQARLTTAQIGFRLALVNADGSEAATAELIWQYRSDSPAAATVQALALEAERLQSADFGAAAPTLRIPIYNNCRPLEEIGDLDLRHPLSSLGAWYAEPGDLRADSERLIKPAARPAAWNSFSAALTELEQAWAAFVHVASAGLLHVAVAPLLKAYERLLGTAVQHFTTASEINAAFRVLNQAWLIGPASGFETWAIVPLLHPLKLFWWRERAGFFNSLIARLLNPEAPAAIIDLRRLQDELDTTYGSSNFPPVLALPPGDNRPAGCFLPIEEAQGYELYFHEQAGAEAFGLDTDLLADDENELAARRAVAGIVAVVQDYIETYPFVRDGVEIFLFECRNGALPGMLVEQLTNTGRRRNWQMRLTVVVHTSERGASLFRRVSKWVAGGHPGVERSGQEYFPPITLKVLECDPDELYRQHEDTDIVILADVLAEKGQRVTSELEDVEYADLPVAGYLPTYQARQEPFEEGELSRRILLASSQQPAVARLFLLCQHAAYDKRRRALKPGQEARFYRELTLDEWRPVIEQLHRHFNWVICYDPSIDRFLLQAAFRDEVQVIRYSLGLGAKRQHNLTVSSSGRTQTIVVNRLAARLGQMFPQAGVELRNAIAARLVAEAKQISGDIVLRAAGPGAFLNELIGLVAAKFATEQRYLAQHPDALTTWILLDDFEHWFSRGQFPDMLFVALGQDAAGAPLLHMEILEAKCVGAINFAIEAHDAQIQVRNGVNRLAPAFAPGHAHLDALYWYDQLYRAIVGNLRVQPEQQPLWELFRDSLHTGAFTRVVSGHTWIFCYDGQADVVNGPLQLPFSEPASEAPDVALTAHHYGRNELAPLLRELIRARDGADVPAEALEQPPIASPEYAQSQEHERHRETETQPQGALGVTDGMTTESAPTRPDLDMPMPTPPRDAAPPHDAVPPHDAADRDAGFRSSTNPAEFAGASTPAIDPAWLHSRARDLERALRQRGIQIMPINPVNADVGPSIVRFKVQLRGNETIRKLQNAAIDLARDLALTSTPFIDNVLGTSFVGIDIPREYVETVALQPLLTALRPPGPAELPIILGVTPSGTLLTEDLAEFPHLLVAGATGSGKSVFLRSILLSLMTQYAPGKLELLIVDPKQTDFSFFDGLPYLRGGKVFTQAEAARDILLDLVRNEMPRRQQLMKGRSLKIKDFNRRFPEEALPPIVALIDEYAQLLSIMTKKDAESFERDLMSLAAVARSTGIHLILATQRPSVNVVTGTLKANLPTRIAFQVPTNSDSRVVLDSNGAENLLGRGDMLFRRPSGELIRLQAPFMDEEQMQAYLATLVQRNR